MIALISACAPGGDLDDWIGRLGEDLTALATVFQGGRNPKLARVAPSPSPLAPERAEQAKAELLQEILRVTTGSGDPARDPALSEAQFAALLNVLGQGASLEGVHNGLAHSATYREAEIAVRSASALALRTFAEEMAELQPYAPSMARFGSRDAGPLPVIDPRAPGGDEAVDPGLFPSFDSGALSREQLAVGYSRVFLSSSIFTLKRVLADELIRAMTPMRREKPKLARWYGAWAARLASKGADFGLKRRNLADARFHERWVYEVSEDQLAWEILNRAHRLLNWANSRR